MSIKIQYITHQGHLYHRCNLKTKTKTKNPKLGLEYNDWNVGEYEGVGIRDLGTMEALFKDFWVPLLAGHGHTTLQEGR